MAASTASKSDGAGSLPGALTNHLDIGAVAPDFELLDGGGAEGVAAQSRTERCSCLKRMASLPMVVVLPEPLTPDHEDDGGRIGDPRGGALAGLEDFEQALADKILQFGGVAKLVALHALADAIEDFVGGVDADVGGDEGEFELIEQIGIDFFLALQGVFESGDQAGAGLLYAALELLKEGGFLFNGAE